MPERGYLLCGFGSAHRLLPVRVSARAIVSNNTANAHAPVITVVPITSRYKAMHMPTHVVLHRCAVIGLTQTSVALAEQVTTIDKVQLQNRVGAVLDEQLMEQITHALQVQIGAVDAG